MPPSLKSRASHDGDHFHHELIGLLGLKEKVIRTSEKDPKKRRLMKAIDSACGLLKFEVAKHKGIISRNLGSFICLFLFKTMMKKRHGAETAIDYILSGITGKEKLKSSTETLIPLKKKAKTRKSSSEHMV
jgi:hypothetical protein